MSHRYSITEVKTDPDTSEFRVRKMLDGRDELLGVYDTLNAAEARIKEVVGEFPKKLGETLYDARGKSIEGHDR